MFALNLGTIYLFEFLVFVEGMSSALRNYKVIVHD
jgi:hypothetical protein